MTFKVGDKVVSAIKPSERRGYAFGYTSGMHKFASGYMGTIICVHDGAYSVEVEGVVPNYKYAENELKLAFPRSEDVKAEKITPPEKVLDIKPRKLYAVIHQPTQITVKTLSTRKEARKLKAALGGKEKGVAIIAYRAVKEIR